MDLDNLLEKLETIAIDIFQLISIRSLEQILDNNWFPEYNYNHHGKAD